MIIKNEGNKVDNEKTTRGIEALLTNLIKVDKSNRIMINLLFNEKHHVYLSDNIKRLINEVNQNRNRKPYSKRFYRMLKDRLLELNINLLIDDNVNHETLLPIQNNDVYKCKSRLNGKVKHIEIVSYKLQSKALPEYQQAIPLTFDNRYDDCLPMVI